jgi:hypothetical protein
MQGLRFEILRINSCSLLKQGPPSAAAAAAAASAESVTTLDFAKSVVRFPDSML